MAWWGSVGLQDSASPLMGYLALFHDHAMAVLVLTLSVVSYMTVSVISNGLVNRSLLSGHLVEVVWTTLPAVILLSIAFPSLRLLYLLDSVDNPVMTIKATGHQWYWSYEYSDYGQLEFDSYLAPPLGGGFRLLETDNHLVIPWGCRTRLLVTSTDVIHSWAIPAMGVKVDAIPGRLNQASLWADRPGLMYGQCSEICGANHSFMPIVLESAAPRMFLSWVSGVCEGGR